LGFNINKKIKKKKYKKIKNNNRRKYISEKSIPKYLRKFQRLVKKD
jgi:hypothetical protein